MKRKHSGSFLKKIPTKILRANTSPRKIDPKKNCHSHKIWTRISFIQQQQNPGTKNAA